MTNLLKIYLFKLFGTHHGRYIKDLKGRLRPVKLEVDGIYMDDHPKYCDAHFGYGIWIDTVEELTDNELEHLSADNQLVYDAVQETIY